jgi:hypothetical protein
LEPDGTLRMTISNRSQFKDAAGHTRAGAERHRIRRRIHPVPGRAGKVTRTIAPGG